MKKVFTNYIETFKGLSTEVWWLALITFINRAGTMVIPFLSLYLKEGLSFTFSQVGWILSCFGLGSFVGSWVGGKLTDTIGAFTVMKYSLFISGLLFGILQFIENFTGLCIGVFLVMVVADSFRPASFVALRAYSKPENRTRSVSLIRLAVNLGFSAGPFIGGIIITYMSYKGLFWVDAVTCIAASVVLTKVLHPKKARVIDNTKNENPVSIFKDKIFWIFFIGLFSFGFTFLQYFSTVPIYYKDVHELSELQIGQLLGFNGFLVFILEMPLTKWLEDKKYSKALISFYGLLLTVISFVLFNISNWAGILIIGIVLMSVGEMLFFPFSNAFALDRSKRGKQGEYMAFYSMAFSLSQIFCHNSGMQLIEFLGFNSMWNIIVGIGIIGLLFIILLMKMIKQEENELKPSYHTIN